jgi:hypothetical protein
MTTIRRALFAVIWTTIYPGLMSAGGGRLITRRDYASVFDGLDGGELRLPWATDPGDPHWSRFWAHYVGKPERIRQLTADAAFDRVLPFAWSHRSTVTGPVGTDAEANVLLYPSAIAVTVHVEVTGEWSLNDLATGIAAIRNSREWTLTTAESVAKGRSLDGIATDMRDRAAKLLASGPPPEAGQQSVLTVAAPASGEGEIASFDLRDETASGCLVGLAVLGPPGTLNEEHLLKENSDPRYGARVYALKSGHAIWHPKNVLDQPKGDPIKCLHRNHTDLVAHVAALAGVVSWAGDQLGAPGGIPVSVQPHVKRAAERLDQLDAGNTVKTYRSGIATTRIEPVRNTVKAVKAALYT